MTRKKGKLITFLWSLIPGAGEMYLGFFKMGSSLMVVFVLLLSLSAFPPLNILSFLSPVMWFYSFFHTNNICGLPDDEFYSLEDDYIIHLNDMKNQYEFFKKHRKFTASCLIFFGAAVLWSNLYRLFAYHLLPYLDLTEGASDFLYSLANRLPQAVIAIAVIAAGILLIRGKSEELDKKEEGSL